MHSWITKCTGENKKLDYLKIQVDTYVWLKRAQRAPKKEGRTPTCSAVVSAFTRTDAICTCATFRIYIASQYTFHNNLTVFAPNPPFKLACDKYRILFEAVDLILKENYIKKENLTRIWCLLTDWQIQFLWLCNILTHIYTRTHTFIYLFNMFYKMTPIVNV